jgi:hypothetical protein
MSTAFDPFNVDDDGDQNISFSSNSMNAFMNFENSFETDNNRIPDNGSPDNRSKPSNGSPDNRSKPSKLIGYSPVRIDRSMRGVDSDIFSELFRGKIPSPKIPSSPSRASNQPRERSLPSTQVSASSQKPTSNAVLPTDQRYSDLFVISLHEQMSCIYDSIPNSQATIEIKGTISLRPNKEVEGKAIYIALNDADKHIQDVTSFFEIAKDVSENVCEREESEFIAMKQEAGYRVFKVKIPSNLQILGSKPINLIKYSGSESFRPIPLVSMKTICCTMHLFLQWFQVPKLIYVHFIILKKACDKQSSGRWEFLQSRTENKIKSYQRTEYEKHCGHHGCPARCQW